MRRLADAFRAERDDPHVVGWTETFGRGRHARPRVARERRTTVERGSRVRWARISLFRRNGAALARAGLPPLALDEVWAGVADLRPARRARHRRAGPVAVKATPRRAWAWLAFQPMARRASSAAVRVERSVLWMRPLVIAAGARAVGIHETRSTVRAWARDRPAVLRQAVDVPVVACHAFERGDTTLSARELGARHAQRHPALERLLGAVRAAQVGSDDAAVLERAPRGRVARADLCDLLLRDLLGGWPRLRLPTCLSERDDDQSGDGRAEPTPESIAGGGHGSYCSATDSTEPSSSTTIAICPSRRSSRG